MKTKNTTRTRLNGYIGIAVATLLTPSGKLISSAVAAATVVGLVSMSTSPKPATVSMSAPPVTYTGAEYIDNELLNAEQLPATEIGSDASVSEETKEVVKLPSVASINVAAAGSGGNGPSGGGLPSSLPLGSGPGLPFDPDDPDGPRPPVLPQPETPECIALNTDNLKIEGLEDVGGTGNPPEGCKPPVVVLADLPDPNMPPEVDEPTVPGNPPSRGEPQYIPPEVSDLPDDAIPTIPAGGLDTIPTGEESIGPFVTAAAIPEPSTLGLLLLGAISFGWVSRRKTKA